METRSASAESGDVDGNAADSASIKRFLLRAFLAAGLPMLTGGAYLIGVSYHQAYLAAFRVPYGFFDKPAADYFIFAYHAVTESSARLWGSTGISLLLGSILGIYLWKAIVAADRYFQTNARVQRLRTTRGFQWFENATFIPMLVLALAYLCLIAFVLIWAPGYFGSEAGRQRASEHLAAFKQGCAKAQESRQFCSDILEEDKLLTTGFVLSVSDKHVAIYEKGRSRVIPIDGKTIQARVNDIVAEAAPTSGSAGPAPISRP